MSSGISEMFAKTEDYFRWSRDDLLSLLDRPLGRVLDVGCGAGANAAWLRANGAAELIGVEVDLEAAARARDRFDQVLSAAIEVVAPTLPTGSVDTIICADVLEHLRDPWTVLQDLRRCASPRGQLVISIPNVRNFRTFVNLGLKGTMGYQQAGLMDITHLRFFTRRDLEQSLTQSGWLPVQWDHNRSGPVARLAGLIGRRILTEFAAIQWYALAYPTSESDAGIELGDGPHRTTSA